MHEAHQSTCKCQLSVHYARTQTNLLTLVVAPPRRQMICSRYLSSHACLLSALTKVHPGHVAMKHVSSPRCQQLAHAIFDSSGRTGDFSRWGCAALQWRCPTRSGCRAEHNFSCTVSRLLCWIDQSGNSQRKGGRGVVSRADGSCGGSGCGAQPPSGCCRRSGCCSGHWRWIALLIDGTSGCLMTSI